MIELGAMLLPWRLTDKYGRPPHISFFASEIPTTNVGLDYFLYDLSGVVAVLPGRMQNQYLEMWRWYMSSLWCVHFNPKHIYSALSPISMGFVFIVYVLRRDTVLKDLGQQRKPNLCPLS